MINLIAPYNKIQYAIINALRKITTTFSINFAKTLFFDFKVFENSKLQNKFYVKTKKKINVTKTMMKTQIGAFHRSGVKNGYSKWKYYNFSDKTEKFLGNHNFASQCRKL